MNRYFTKTFVRFLVGFVAIIALAFGVLAIASSFAVPVEVDNVAAPR